MNSPCNLFSLISTKQEVNLSVKTIYKIFMGNNDKVQVYEDQTGNKTMHKKKIDIFNVFFRCKIFNVF